jgi:hypothetical protein
MGGGDLIQKDDFVRIKNTKKIGPVCSIRKDKSGEVWYCLSLFNDDGSRFFWSELEKDVIELSPEEQLQYKMEV